MAQRNILGIVQKGDDTHTHTQKKANECGLIFFPITPCCLTALSHLLFQICAKLIHVFHSLFGLVWFHTAHAIPRGLYG